MADFKKKSRLLSASDYNKVFSKSVKVANSHFIFLIHKSSLKHSRLGLVISKKVDKRAVQRNRIKRLVREVFRNFDENHYQCDYVVIGKHNISKFNNSDLLNSLTELFAKAQKKLKSFR